MHRIRLIEKRGVAPLTENERAEVAAGVTSYPEGKDVVLSGGADAAIRYYHGGQGGSLPLKEVGELLDDFFASIKDDWALAEIVTIGTPHWSESLEGDIFPVKLRNKPMMYWVMYTDGYGRNVSRSTYSHAGSAEEAASPKGDASPKGAVSLRAKKWAKKALAVFERWMHFNSRSIYNCTMAEPDILPALPPDCRFTQSADGKRLYLHLFAYPFAHVLLWGMAGKVAYAQFLHDGSEIRMTEGEADHFSEGAAKGKDLLALHLPIVKPDMEVPVIEMFLK